MLLNFGAGFNVPEEKWKDLTNLIEQIATGQMSLPSLQQMSRKLPLYMHKTHHLKSRKRRDCPLSLSPWHWF
jgi:hypothetical protein